MYFLVGNKQLQYQEYHILKILNIKKYFLMSKHFASACQLAISIANISVKNMYHCHDPMSNKCTTEHRL